MFCNKKFSTSIVFCLGLISIFSLASQADTIPEATLNFSLIKTININKPAFLNLETFENEPNTSLIVSSFGSSKDAKVTLAMNSQQLLTSLSPEKEFKVVSDKIVWPNNITQVPYQVFQKRGFLVAGGFLVPGNSTGAITFVDIDTNKIYPISPIKSNWFYHMAILKDMDGDKLLDIVSARANKPLLGSGKGELVWFKNPGTLTTTWKEKIITTGPDVNFQFKDLNGDGTDEIIATQFFTKKFMLYYYENNQLKSKEIASIGSPFDVEFYDLNLDGKEEMLVTNHDSIGSIFAFNIPDNFKTETFTKHILLTNIKTLQNGIGQASPGKAIVFKPYSTYNGKPYIIVAGDGSQKAHLLIPKSSNPNNMDYTEEIVLDAKCVVGQIAVGDVDYDGSTELFIPAYDNNKIYVYKFNK